MTFCMENIMHIKGKIYITADPVPFAQKVTDLGKLIAHNES